MNQKSSNFYQSRGLFSSTTIIGAMIGLSIQLFLSLSCLLFISCKHGSAHESNADLSFAIGNIENSLLKDIMKTKGRLPVCLGLIGFDSDNRQYARQFYTESAIKVANAWNSLLFDNRDWPVKHKITLEFDIRETQCPAMSLGFGINVWGNAADFERDYCSDHPICSSVTATHKRLIFIGPINRGKPVGVFNYFTILHEYGHLLGLGDTYRNPGMSDWDEDQPPSVMNGENFPRDAFTEDDRWGIWAVFWSLKTGLKNCSNYGSAVPMRLNAWNAMMCDPRTVATYQHRSILNLPELPDPPANELDSIPVRTGIWAYDGFDVDETAMLIKDVSASDSGVSFRSIGVNNGTTSSQRGSLYNCKKSPNTDTLTCTASTNSRYRMEFTSPVSGSLFTPDYEEGIKIILAR